MNAPAKIIGDDARREAQALLARCKEERWKLLQQFARLEIKLQRGLPKPPKTFGSKVRAWIKEDPTAKRFESLIPARNLVAHAFIQCIEFKGVTSALWEIADGTGDLNCKKLDDVALNDWARQLLSLIDEAIVAAEAMKKR